MSYNIKTAKTFSFNALLFLNLFILTVVLYCISDNDNKNLQSNEQKYNRKQQQTVKNEVVIKLTEPEHPKQYVENDIVFGDNVSGYPFNVVPNIFHYVLFDINSIDFVHYLSLLSLLRNHKPEQIMLHCNCDTIVGNYWQNITILANSSGTVITINKVEKITEIFGKPLNKAWVNWHGSDIMRIKVLMKYGGIYLDRDVYVVKSLNEFRKYEMTINWKEGHNIGNQVLIANKNARFLQKYLDTYRSYDPSKWYYNAGELPIKAVLNDSPQLVHRVEWKFGVYGYVLCPRLYTQNYANWEQEYHTIHLLIRGNTMIHVWCLANAPKTTLLSFDEHNVKTLNVTFGQMARMLLYNTKDLIYD